MDPTTLKYRTTHEWVSLDGETATVGISDFAVNQLTDLVYIEFPEVGSTLQAGDPFGVVESVKAVSDLYAPISGEVIAVNQLLEDKIEVLSNDPFGEGWIIRLKASDPNQLTDLLDKAAYDKHCESEAH